MKFNPGLSTRVTFGVLLLLVAGALLWVKNENSRLQDSYLGERSTDLETALHVEQVRLSQSIGMLRQDLLFLSSIPPVSGIVRASLNNGLDPRDKDSIQTWETRMQEIFAAFLRAHLDYFQVRFIGAAGEGMELVRVVNRGGSVEVVPRESLQAQGEQDYFRIGLIQTVGRVHLSGFRLNREQGKIEEPYRPTISAVTTVFDSGGRVFGMIVIDKDVHSLFATMMATLPYGVRGYISDQRGHYLAHPDGKLAFAYELGNGRNIINDFPSLRPMFDSQTLRNKLPFHAAADGVGGYMAAERVFFDASDPSRFLLLVYHLPAEMMGKHGAGIPLPDIVDIVLVMVLIGGASMLVLRRTFSPLKRITAAALEIAAGNRQIRLEEKDGGEVGELTHALNTMLDKLSVVDLIKQENTFRKELVESLPGIFYMIDARGKFLMWNRNLEKVLQRSQEEMASSHPLDFFEGEYRDRIAQSIRAVFETGEAVVEAELVAKDNTRKAYFFTGRRVTRGGEQVLVGMGLDLSEHRRAEAVLKRHQVAIETMHDGYFLADAQGYLLEANEAYARMSGYATSELVGMHIGQLDVREQSAEEVARHISWIIAEGYDVFETRHRRKDGAEVDVEMSMTFISEVQQLVVFCRDITVRKRDEEALRIAAATFETHDAILITDSHANIIRVNRAFTEITGYTQDEVKGRNPSIMSSGRQDQAFYAAMWKKLLETGCWAGEIWDRRKNGEIYPKWLNITAVKNELGETSQYVAIFSDITVRKREEEEIRSMAFYDALTQLPNRRLFLERLQTALAASERYNDYGAILFIDLDRFKQLNDTKGHDYGDLLLIELAKRIRSCVREIDTVARLGGDEFVVLLESSSSEREDAAHNAGLVAEKIRGALARPYRLKEHLHSSFPSIGVSLYHANELPMDVLLQQADAAMYRSKEEGGNTVRFYDTGLQEKWQSGELKGRTVSF